MEFVEFVFVVGLVVGEYYVVIVVVRFGKFVVGIIFINLKNVVIVV